MPWVGFVFHWTLSIISLLKADGVGHSLLSLASKVLAWLPFKQVLGGGFLRPQNPVTPVNIPAYAF